jgi:hypothetical protein
LPFIIPGEGVKEGGSGSFKIKSPRLRYNSQLTRIALSSGLGSFFLEGDSEMQQLAGEVIECGSELIENDTFPRPDYLELLQLTVLFIGGIPI